MAATKNSNRRYISEDYSAKKVFLVYQHKKNKISSEGPYTKLDDAEGVLRKLLLEGICAWMVSYNETKG